jgi:arsenate reductase
MEEKGIEPEVVKYLENPPSAEELREIISLLGVNPRDLMRKKEDLYKKLELADENLGDEALITAMVANPRLIERPIVISNNRAAIGRPPQKVLDIL